MKNSICGCTFVNVWSSLAGFHQRSGNTSSSTLQWVAAVLLRGTWALGGAVWHSRRHEAAAVMASVALSRWQCLAAGYQCSQQPCTNWSPTATVQRQSALRCWSYSKDVGHLEGVPYFTVCCILFFKHSKLVVMPVPLHWRSSKVRYCPCHLTTMKVHLWKMSYNTCL